VYHVDVIVIGLRVVGNKGMGAWQKFACRIT